MKKILTSLMLVTASFMLLFTLTTHEVHAVGETEEYTFEFTTNDGFFVGNATDNYLFSYLEMIYNASANPDFEILIDHIDYNDITVTRNINDYLDGIYYFITITTDTNNYVINVELDDIDPYFDDGLPNNTYTLTINYNPPVYEDLFYEVTEVEFEILNQDNYTGSLTPGTFNILTQLFELTNPIILDNGKYNDTELDYLEIYNNTDYESIDVRFYIDEDTYIISIFIDDTFELQDADTFENDTITMYFSKTKNWTQAHDYGRVRTNESTLYLNQPSSTAVFLSHSPTNNVIDVNNIAVGDEIIMQSPFSKFEVDYGNIGFPRVKLVTQDNIAAVKMIKHSTKNYSFVLYYWFEGEIRSRTVSDIDLSNRNSLNITFSGDLRKAIDYQDVMVANVDDLVPLNDFLQYLTAFDPIDGDISDSITVLDDGGYLPEQVGVYNVQFEVTNSQEQQTTIIIPIHVVDIVAPVITGSTDVVNISYDQTFNVTNWVNSLTVTDNYYTGLSISIKENTYTVNKSVIGTYHITVEAVDPSGNKGTLTRTINVTDGIGPVFDGINTITASINENLTAEQIKAGLAAVDAIDGNVTSSITIDSDGLLGNQNTPGTYQIVFRAEDLTGNHTLHTVEVTIVSSPPGFYILNSNSVRLLPGADLTIEQILTLLGVPGATEISTNYDASKPGTYNLSFTFGGEVHTLSITVLGQNDAPIPTPTVPDDQQTNTRLIIIILVTAAAVSLIGYTLVRKYKK